MKLLLLGRGSVQVVNLPHYVTALVQDGWEVRRVLNQTAELFVPSRVLRATTGVRVYTNADFFERVEPLHIELGEWADVVGVAPLSANTLAKSAIGMADNIVTAPFLAALGIRAVFPHMGDAMWRARATARNVRKLEEDGVRVVRPTHKITYVCSEGETRMAIAMPGPRELVSEVRAMWEETLAASRKSDA
jgi:phosphopantothenoylcysteine decarboxylase/phosphopantothenate--cysteine ligase